MAPTYMKADSGRWSCLPSHSSLKLRIVSGQRRILALLVGECLGHDERLRQELLDAPGPVHHLLVFFAQFINTQNGDDVLQFTITLQDLLHAAGDREMLLADILGLKNVAVRRQRIDRRIDALFGDLPFQIDEGVEVLKGVGRGRIGRIVGRHVHGLHAGDGPTVGAGDALLQLAHLRGQRRLITDGAGHATKEGRHFRAGLREAEDVIDEQQGIGPRRIPEPFAHRQGRQGHAQTGPRRLIHLAEHHGGLLDDGTPGVADLGLLHFQPQVVALARSFADTGKHRITAVLAGDTGNQLGEDHRLAQAGTTEQARLAATHQRRQQIDDLDSGLEDFRLRRQLGELRRIPMNGAVLGRGDRATTVDRLAQEVEDPAQRLLAHRHLHRLSGVHYLHAAHQTIGRPQRHAAHAVAAQVLLHLAGQTYRHALVVVCSIVQAL